ncbi:MAG: hypothetical protein Q9214_004910 [Letrouitia sp. 1 TL-2023]
MNSVLTTILEAFCVLLPYHPSVFRPFAGQLRELLRYLLAPTPSNVSSEGTIEGGGKRILEATASSARRLLVILCSCAPKSTSSQEWVQSLQKVVDQCHRTADLVFRAVIEDLVPSRAIQAENAQRKSFDAIVNEPEGDLLYLPSWIGIHGGIERLQGHIKTLQAFVITTTSSSVAFPLEKVADVAKRVLLVLPPGEAQDELSSSSYINPEVDKEELEVLLVALPRLHVSAVSLIMSLLIRFERGLAASISEILEQILWTFCSQRGHDDVRRAIYDVLSLYLSSFGPTTPRNLASMISNCVETACEDLLPSNATTQKTAQNGINAEQPSENGAPSKSGSSYISSTGQTTTFPNASTQIKAAARALICSALRDLPNNFLLPTARAQVDVVSVLVDDNKDLLEANTMYPQWQKQRGEQRTILPFFARKFAGCERVEALTRPRMPSLQLKPLEDIIQIHSQNVFEKNASSTSVPVVLNATVYSEETVFPGSLSEMPQLSDPPLEPSTQNQACEKRAESTSPPIVPSKRSHEPITSPVDKPPALGDAPSSTEEHRNKRLHLARDGVYDPPSESQSQITKPVEPYESSHLMKLSPAEEALPDLKAMDETRSDDDSDDSVIPPIDLEMPSDEDNKESHGGEEDDKSSTDSLSLRAGGGGGA